MFKATCQFYGELNFFLPSPKKEISFDYEFKKHPAIKDAIESLGIPHPEVNQIVVNGASVDFSYGLKDGDHIEVYPISQTPENISVVKLRADLPSHITFVLDVHLGKLASSLRMLGFDTWYRNDYDDEELAIISATKNRILLTRDTGLLMRSLVTHGYYVRSTNPEKQLAEVLQRFELVDLIKPFQRCIRCNGDLESVEKEEILDQIPPKTRQYVDEFHRCRECEQIYWRGSHYEQMQKLINSVIGATEFSYKSTSAKESGTS